MKQFVGMLLTAVALLSGLNASRVSADEETYSIDASYWQCTTSSFSGDWSKKELTDCFYLDYSSSVTLTVGKSKYKNPIFFCPGGATSIKFEPDSGIYCTKFSLYEVINSNGDCKGYRSLYVATQATSFKTPVSKAKSSSCSEYFDLILAPIESGTIALSGTVTEEIINGYESNKILAVYDTTKESSTVTVTVSSGASHTILKSIDKRYSISLPEEGPYVFNGKNGLSIGVIVGIAVVAVVVVGAAVGVSVYFILKNRKKKGKGDESSSSSS